MSPTPLAEVNKGRGIVLLVTLLTLVGWVPGALAAIFVCYHDKSWPSKSSP